MEKKINGKENNSDLVLGIDDAGRGPVIGCLVLAGVLLKKEDESLLKEQGVADSKQLIHSKRVELAEIIKNTAIGFYIVKAEPEEIDNAVNSKINLNTLEAMKTAEIINNLNSGEQKIKVVVDCPSVNTKAWRSTLMSYIKDSENLDVICEHKADVNHPSVSAASILAKVAREDAVSKLKEKFKKYGDMGSGYPSDPFTKKFLKKSGLVLKDSGIFRKSWATWKSLFPEKDQKTLGEY